MTGTNGGGGNPAQTTDGPGPGDRVGPYRLVRLLGEGAIGRVFEVEYERISRRAAMKMLSAEHACRPGSVLRLFAEAQAVNRINNPHIVEITEIIEASVSGGVNAVVMEFLEGQSLAQAASQDGTMAPERFLPILAQICDALAAAHAAGFVHRDLKPDNVFLTERSGQVDYVKLLDFGLVKMLTLDESVARNVAQASRGIIDGTFVGTPAYVSPEQASGRPVDHRTDIYSLGVIIYELLCGHLPFEGTTIGDFLVKHLTVPPPPAPPEVVRTRLGRALDAVARRCLAKDPLRRYSSAAQLGDVLRALARGDFSGLDEVAAVERTERRRKLRLVAGAAAVLALVATSTALLVGGGGHRSPAPTPEAAPAYSPPPDSPRVVITFTSQPPGAQTRRVGDPDLLGLTPFPRTFEARDELVEFEMTLDGYYPVRVPVSMATTGTVSIPLRRRGAPTAAPPRARAGARPDGTRP